MKTRDVPQSGSRGRAVASRNRFGPFQRERVSPEQPGTPAQRETWRSMTELSQLWNELGEVRRVAWQRQAEEVHSRPNLAQWGPLDGCHLFKKLNRVLETCGRPALLDPPLLPEFDVNPVRGFEVCESHGRPVFKLSVSPKVRWEARSPLEDLMVFSWAPCNAGVSKHSLFVFLGLPPAPEDGEINFTKLYLAKLKEWRKLEDKRYHVPAEGSKVFVRVWQQINGWENEVGMFQASAPVPLGVSCGAWDRPTRWRTRPTARQRQ